MDDNCDERARGLQNVADDIRLVNRYTVAPEDVDAVKHLLSELIDRVRTDDPGTLSYEWYLDEDASELFLVAWWKDSDALIAHEALFAKDPIVEQFHEKAPVNRTEIYGDVTDKLLEVLPGAKKMSKQHWNGFTRNNAGGAE
jgi:quinol monooxygenase YgiN